MKKTLALPIFCPALLAGVAIAISGCGSGNTDTTSGAPAASNASTPVATPQGTDSGATAASTAGPGSAAATAGAPGAASDTQVALTDDPASHKEKTTFSPTTETIYLEAQLASSDADTTAKAALIYDKTNYKVLEDTLPVKAGEKGIEFKFSKPTKGWPEGDYHIDFSVGGKLDKTMNFKIAADNVDDSKG